MTLSAVIADLTRPGDDEYIIWPASPISEVGVRLITELVTQEAGGAGEVYNSRVAPGPSPLYWLARLPTGAIGSIRSLPEVRSVDLNKVAAKPFSSNPLSIANATFPNSPRFATQKLPATELRVISQPSGAANIDHYRNYIYRTDKRRETYIYHAELGINEDHDEFQGFPIEWVWTSLQLLKGGRTRNEAPSGYYGHREDRNEMM